jgi:hypothetical protein
VNAGQIIPVFTIVWDDGSQRAKGKKNGAGTSPTDFLGCPYAFLNLVRVHDEATTSDDGGDTGNQFNIVARADEHGKKANDD